MIVSLQLQNFRGFDNHTLKFKRRTIVVGKNNAGKSTIVEALRLVSIVVRRYRNLPMVSPPKWLDLGKWDRGISPSTQGLQLASGPLFHRYGSAPAVITAKFANGTSVKVYVGPDAEVHALLFDAKSKRANDKRNIDIPGLGVMAAIGPLQPEKKELNEAYVRSNMDGMRSSLHFRNQLQLYRAEFFAAFRQIAETGWTSLQVKSLDAAPNFNDTLKTTLALIVRDGDFSAEVDSMGHGLQMWLQMAWFLARTQADATIVLDEPDVYMHADMQRRLMRLLRSDAKRQVIIATHSTEIMAEAEPEDILLVDRRQAESRFAHSLPGVQSVVEAIGSVHNIALARLASARSFLLVEGTDVQLLKRFQNTLFPDSTLPIDTIPSMDIKGWSGWFQAVGTARMLKNESGDTIHTYCILDSDYRTTDQIEERYRDAAKTGIRLHVWQRKEIENYLLEPTAIQRFIDGKVSAKVVVPTVQEVGAALESMAEARKEEVLGAWADEFHAQNRAAGVGTATKHASRLLQQRWTGPEKIHCVAGSALLSDLSAWSKKEFGVSISDVALAREVRASEMSPELVAVLTAIEQHELFPRRPQQT
jgi:predicted ATPase